MFVGAGNGLGLEMAGVKAVLTSLKAGVNVKAVLRLLNTAFLPISQSRFKRHKSLCLSH